MEATTATAQAIEARVMEALIEFGADPDQMSRDASLEDLDVDSLDLVELGQILAQEFGIQPKPEDFENVVTVGDALDVILGYLN